MRFSWLSRHSSLCRFLRRKRKGKRYLHKSALCGNKTVPCYDPCSSLHFDMPADLPEHNVITLTTRCRGGDARSRREAASMARLKQKSPSVAGLVCFPRDKKKLHPNEGIQHKWLTPGELATPDTPIRRSRVGISTYRRSVTKVLCLQSSIILKSITIWTSKTMLRSRGRPTTINKQYWLRADLTQY